MQVIVDTSNLEVKDVIPTESTPERRFREAARVYLRELEKDYQASILKIERLTDALEKVRAEADLYEARIRAITGVVSSVAAPATFAAPTEPKPEPAPPLDNPDDALPSNEPAARKKSSRSQGPVSELGKLVMRIMADGQEHSVRDLGRLPEVYKIANARGWLGRDLSKRLSDVLRNSADAHQVRRGVYTLAR